MKQNGDNLTDKLNQLASNFHWPHTMEIIEWRATAALLATIVT